MVSIDAAIQAIFLIVGVFWCKEVLGRWRDDVEELRTGDTTRRVVTIIIWLATLSVALFVGRSVWMIAMRIIRFFP